MTRIKLCGLTRSEDVEAVNLLKPDYIGFVFAPGRKRTVCAEKAAELKRLLSPDISAVGVFVNEAPETIAALAEAGIIDLCQIHGTEDEAYLKRLKALTRIPVIQAFRIRTAEDILAAERSMADYILLDSGAGSGETFDWSLIPDTGKGWFLAGGLDPDNVTAAIHRFHPFAVDVSSGIETDGIKDPHKMAAFVAAVRKEDAT